jgi:hypothetical protein
LTHPTTKIQQVHTHKESYKFQQSFVTIFILPFYNANPLIYKGEVKALGLGHKTLVTFGKVTSGPTLKDFCLFTKSKLIQKGNLIQKVESYPKGDQIKSDLTLQLHNNLQSKSKSYGSLYYKKSFPMK